MFHFSLPGKPQIRSTQARHCHKAFFQNEEPATRGRLNNAKILPRPGRKCHLQSSCRDLAMLASEHHLFLPRTRSAKEIEWKKSEEILATGQNHPIPCLPISSNFEKFHQYFPWRKCLFYRQAAGWQKSSILTNAQLNFQPGILFHLVFAGMQLKLRAKS